MGDERVERGHGGQLAVGERLTLRRPSQLLHRLPHLPAALRQLSLLQRRSGPASRRPSLRVLLASVAVDVVERRPATTGRRALGVARPHGHVRPLCRVLPRDVRPSAAPQG